MKPGSRHLFLALAVVAGLGLGVVAWQVLSANPALQVPEVPSQAGLQEEPAARPPPGEDDRPPRGRGAPPPEAGPPPSLAEARALLEVSGPVAAAEALDRILRAEPGNVEALVLRGQAHLAMPQMERRAEQDFRRALDLGEERVDVLTGLGAAVLRTRPPDAEKYLTRAIELDGNAARPWGLLARLRFQRGDREAAREAVDRALSLDAADAEALQVRNLLLPR